LRREDYQVHGDERQHRYQRSRPELTALANVSKPVTAKEDLLGDPRLSEEAGD
jgi:hypothetical protein